MIATETPYIQYFDLAGSPLDGGYIYFGLPNEDPETTPITVYWDAAGTIPAAQPLRTLNGYVVRAGAIANVFCDDEYSITIKNSNGVLVAYAPASSEFDASFSVRNLTDLLDGVVHLTGDETIDGVKTFTSTPIAPTPAQFDIGLSVANMAAVQRAIGNYRGGFAISTTPVSLTAAQVGMLVNVIAAASVINLPDGTTVPTGSSFRFYIGVNVTLNAVGGQQVFASPNTAGSASLALVADSVYDVTWNDTAWIVSKVDVVPAKLSTASGSAPSYSARAWVDFDGTGTPAIRASGNVSSITDNGVGDYTINFTTAMPDANYGTVGMVGGTASSFVVRIPDAPAQVAGSQRIWTMSSASALQDIAYVNVTIFR